MGIEDWDGAADWAMDQFRNKLYESHTYDTYICRKCYKTESVFSYNKLPNWVEYDNGYLCTICRSRIEKESR